MNIANTSLRFTVESDLSNEHAYLHEYFPNFDYRKPYEPERIDYRRSDNTTGFFQRACLVYWAIECGKRGDIGIDIGGAGVHHPWILSTDSVRSGGIHPVYGGEYKGVHLACDAADLSMLGTETFGVVLSSHVIEHLPCKHFVGQNVSLLDPAYKRSFQCDGAEIIPILRDHWIRILKPGGTLVVITPDENVCDGFGADKSHQHSWKFETFRDVIIAGVSDLIETIEFISPTHFSMLWVAKKR